MTDSMSRPWHQKNRTVSAPVRHLARLVRFFFAWPKKQVGINAVGPCLVYRQRCRLIYLFRRSFLNWASVRVLATSFFSSPARRA